MDVWTVDDLSHLPPLAPRRIVAMMLARNEDWIIGLSARAALQWCDGLYVYCHKCTDRTQDIIDDIAREYPDRVMRAWSDADNWNEMDMRETMLRAARTWGMTHGALVDADEVLTGNLLPTIRQTVLSLKPGEALEVPMIPTWRSLDRYRTDACVWTRARISLAFADQRGVCWKAENGYQHHHRLPYGVAVAERCSTRKDHGGAMHLQFADWPRLTAKHCVYKMWEVTRFNKRTVEEIEAVYNQALDETGLETKPCPAEWWDAYRQWLPLVRLDAEPWQAAEARRLYAQHGAEKFGGLNLFGVVQ